VPADAAQRIRERDETALIVRNADDKKDVPDDDPYKNFAVPDDLTW
jgi:uncharacterized protein YaiL (DUF2058 family)